MTQYDQRGRSKTKEQYVRLTYAMIASPAFQSLPALAVALYVHVAGRYAGDNNGNISFSVREAAKVLGTGKATAGRMFDELVAKGFLKVTQESNFTYKQKQARRWELTQWPLRHGVAPSNDWRFWKPAEQKGVSASAVGAENRFQEGEVRC